MRPTVGRLLWRALAPRCPLCGRGPMFDGWFSLRARCGECGFAFERDEEDYWLGAFLLKFIVTEVIFAVLLVAVLVATWPDPPFSKALWLAGDLIFRPPTAADFATRAGEDET
jgi:uncharacterized protein (DUF983 family)